MKPEEMYNSDNTITGPSAGYKEEMSEQLMGSSPTNGSEQGDRDEDNFIVSNENPIGTGRTVEAMKCNACGGIKTADGQGDSCDC